MYKTEDGKTKFSFTKLISNAVPNIAGTPQDIHLTSHEEDLAFLHQINEPDPFVLSSQVFTHAGITSEPKASASIHKALLKNGVIQQGPPYIHTDNITRNFANQVPGITSHAQKKLINFLFFWEEEGQRWRKLSGELEELKVVIAEERESGGNAGTYEKRLAEVEGEMRLRPSLRSHQAGENAQLPGYGQLSATCTIDSGLKIVTSHQRALLRWHFTVFGAKTGWGICTTERSAAVTMTKDWDVVQDEIKELSFNQKKPLEEVKELMERKHNFRASTRAYRMKLKEWGLMRHKSRKPRLGRSHTDRSGDRRDDDESRAASVTVDPMSVDTETLEHQTSPGAWQAVGSGEMANAQPTFMDILKQTPGLQPTVEIQAWMQDPPVASGAVQDMLECILNNECEKLEKLLMEHVNEVNDPIGLPFDLPNSRFANHPALSRMVIMQHPRQTLLDVASAMPNGPVVWVLISYGARGSTHPLGFDLSLHNAIKNGRHYTVQALLIPGRSDVNGLPDQRWRPLLQAVVSTGPEVVSVLLKRGARVDDVGLSPASPGMHTALHLCLERRAREYGDEAIRSQCNENLKLLLHANANIHVSPPEGSTKTAFEKFIEPWNDAQYWNFKLGWAEMDCLGIFVKKGADLSTKFSGSPCAAGSCNTFVHQILWHCPPCISRHVMHDYPPEAPVSGALLLHEVVGHCPDARRHCAELLEDIDILLTRGVDPNAVDSVGMTTLRKCIEQASTTDVLPLSQKLLDGGADPEYEDVDGIRPYTVAARNLAEPLRTEVLQAMLAKMRGHSTVTKDGRTYRWEAGLFPIPEHPTYQQVLACTKSEDDFQLSMHEMVPIDVQPAFQRAYLATISGRFLNNVAKAASANKISEKDRWNIMLTLSLRKRVKLPDYQFDQGLVIALLDFPNIDTPRFNTAATTIQSTTTGTTSQDSTPQSTPLTEYTSSIETPAYSPFQLNTERPSAMGQFQATARPSKESDTSNDAFVGDTTQIRWLNPESSDGGAATAATYLLQYKCPVCADGRLLTKTEFQRHEAEHAHTAGCDGVGCARRFCKEKRNRAAKEVGCSDNVFAQST
ncbi:hypothetical protein SVAN01_07753 [Stagonosporopsis vannaccii]|nr:hypothetical protein SVAN01_07753 [Stagonosporopsis vannaccii]